MGEIRDISILKGHRLVFTELVIHLKLKPQPEAARRNTPQPLTECAKVNSRGSHPVSSIGARRKTPRGELQDV